MTIERSFVLGLVATGCLAIGGARGADFNERYAAWQSGQPMGQRSVMPQRMPGSAQSMPAASAQAMPAEGEFVEQLPSSGAQGGQKILSNVYGAPLHTPDYNRP